ncbi:MAG: SIMPL domain-containing protein [Pseudomonadota bacterium]
MNRILIACAALFVLSGCWLDQNTPKLTVTGKGSVEVEPDRFSIALSALGRGKSQAAAIAAMNAELKTLRAELPTLVGLEEIEFTTQDVVLLSVPDPVCIEQYTNEAARFCEPEEFLAFVEVSVVASPASVAGNMFSLATEITEQEINVRSFQLSNRDQYYSDAVAAAVDNARSQAKVLAKASGFAVGKVVQVNPEERYGVAYDRAMAPQSDEGVVQRQRTPAEQIELNPGPRYVNAEVEVTFELIPLADEM